MQENSNESLFTEINNEESTTINGAYANCGEYNYRRRVYNRKSSQSHNYMYYPRQERSYRTLVVLKYR